MRDAQPATVYLKDYQPPAYRISHTELHFALDEDCVSVSSRLRIERQHGVAQGTPLRLHGEALELLSVEVDGRALAADEYQLGAESLTIFALPALCHVSCKTRIEPQKNTSLSGMYKSRDLFCTQCEAEGFRRITYYLDQPDVMAIFTVTIEAQRARYPVLLSNGNCTETESLPNGYHRAVWHDPHPKPAYLFALVAGDLAHVEDSFTTVSGIPVTLRIFVEEKDLEKCGHAMRSLQHAMRWDEEVYGREYDLDIFNIVAVDDFNMGAMENKSLNLFNTACVLCTPEVTTDAGFQRIEAIVAHEYFHNWSGNRVTCRDWFQLSLKEGFTVFRDAQFSAHMGSPTVKRIEDATLLRTAQFAEDAGPMAHPIRPESFMEINNFYTLTVYEKGAEVVRMIHTLLGAAQFRAGSDLYFARHDGEAVTCEDFVCAMEDASGTDLSQFRNWYSQAGTPLLVVKDAYDASTQQYTLTVEQSCPATPGQSEKAPFVIPLVIGLLGGCGNLPMTEIGDTVGSSQAPLQKTLIVSQREQTFVFEHVKERPVPSLLRGFSAPVRLQYDYSTDDLCALMRHDADGFVRWDASHALATGAIAAVERQLGSGATPQLDPRVTAAWGELVQDNVLDPALVAEMLRLPAEDYLAELASRCGGADVDTIHQARDTVRKALGKAHHDLFLARYQQLSTDLPYAPEASQIADRAMRNTCLAYLVSAGSNGLALAAEQYRLADNMTDQLAALKEIAFYGDDPLRDATLNDFYQHWQHEVLVVNQWLQVQAAIPDQTGFSRVQSLLSHAEFDLHNPNKVRALVGTFANHNPVNFHRQDGAGYRLLCDIVIQLNSVNPQMASRLLTPLTRWRNYQGREHLMLAELERLAAQPALSQDVFEIVTKSLQGTT